MAVRLDISFDLNQKDCQDHKNIKERGCLLCPFQVHESSRELSCDQIKDVHYTFSAKINTYRHVCPYAAA